MVLEEEVAAEEVVDLAEELEEAVRQYLQEKKENNVDF